MSLLSNDTCISLWLYPVWLCDKYSHTVEYHCGLTIWPIWTPFETSSIQWMSILVAYELRLNNLAESCTKNNPLLKVSKAKELIFDFRKIEEKIHTPVCISRAKVKQVNSFRFQGISITKNLSWSSHISTLVKKAHKQLYSSMVCAWPRTSMAPICRAFVTYWWGEVPAQSLKDTKRQYPTQPQPVHPVAIWQEIRKYLLSYHQTPEQLLSSGCETFKFIPCTKSKLIVFLLCVVLWGFFWSVCVCVCSKKGLQM